MQIRNPQYNAFGTIDCEIEHPQFGWIPFTAAPDDVEAYGQEIYSRALEVGPESYVAPPQPEPVDPIVQFRASASLTKPEFCLALKRMKILSVEEAKAASKGEWPQSFADALESLPTLGIDPDEAEILWGSVTVIERMHPLFLALKEKANVTDEQADAMFGWAG